MTEFCPDMEFPAYVPDVARRCAMDFLENFEPWLKGSEADLATTIEEAIAASMQRGETEYLDGLRQRQAAETEMRDYVASEIATVLRLVQDARMKDAYRILTGEFFADEEREQKVNGFIDAASRAARNFAAYRRLFKRAAALRNEIAETAAKLEGLLQQIRGTGVTCPPELFCISELLRLTNNSNSDDFHVWQAMNLTESGDAADASVPPIVRFDPVVAMANTWVPPLPALLATVADVARRFNPSKSGFIGAAISSRKQNPKTEYLRAFAHLLTNEHRFILTTPIMHAMARAASVVINDPDFDVTYDDVRKALARLSGKAPEDSSEK